MRESRTILMNNTRKYTREDFGFCTIYDYPNYISYIKHQSSKLQILERNPDWFEKYNRIIHKYLRERLVGLEFIKKGNSVLCLGARLGVEVKVFKEIGNLSIGIDIEPGTNNNHVLFGDFHEIKFASNVFDMIYTNSLDHSFDLMKVVKEIYRVLKMGGHLILDASSGLAEGGRVDKYASIQWDRMSNLSAFISDAGFNLTSRKAFLHPWKGEQLCLQRC